MLTGPPPKSQGTDVVAPTALEARKWVRWPGRVFRRGLGVQGVVAVVIVS